jgi:membrane fusion protein (multidrug efflux system)
MSDINPGSKEPKRKVTIIIVNILLAIALLAGIVWAITTYFDLDHHLYTNDAQVEEYINPVNVRIPGYIREVRYQEHQRVKKGDTLVIIDDREFKIQLEQAEAAYLSALAAKSVSSSSVNTIEGNVKVSKANIDVEEARLGNAEKDYHRFANLLKDSAATQQQFDQQKTDYDALLAQTNALKEQRKTTLLSTVEASKRVDVNEAEIKRAHAALELAKLNLSYTVITAPYDGVTGRRNVEEGQLVQPGQTLLSFIRTNNKWVVANYKETQIARVHIGQKLLLKIDGLGGKEIPGRVAAIAEATGSRYSALPIDNSTGNFVKVQQRIPVKIEFAPAASDRTYLDSLRAGMNVEVRLAN